MSYPRETEQLVSCFVFGSSGVGGNEASVALERHGLPVRLTAQRIARAIGTPVTVFAAVGSEPIPVRFFTPRSELAFCGHGTLAVGSLLASRLGRSRVRLLAQDLEVAVDWEPSGLATLTLPGPPRVEECPDRERLVALLGAPPSVIASDRPFVIGDAGSPKWFVPLRNWSDLRALRPDFEGLSEYSSAQGVNGIYAYTLDTQGGGGHARARSFNPKAGANEDAATGSAAAVLGWLFRDLPSPGAWFFVDQGVDAGSLNRIYTRVTEEGRILVGGEVRFSQAVHDR